jgi:hypothetical protein
MEAAGSNFLAKKYLALQQELRAEPLLTRSRRSQYVIYRKVVVVFLYVRDIAVGDEEMRAICTYVLVYGLTYGVLLVLDALILGGGHWAHIAMLLISGELFRLYINMINPGFEDRMLKKYGAPGRKLAERLHKDSQEPR